MTAQDELALETHVPQPDPTNQARYLDGCTDAGFGQLPQYVDETYLAGYLATLKSLPTDDTGKIQHYSPRQHFAFGYVDNPDPGGCEEF